MKKNLSLLLALSLLLVNQLNAQEKDAVQQSNYSLSGTLSISTNGFSIVPSFSLNDPAILTLLSFRKNNFSIDPDIRVTPNLEKGSMLLWFRYHAINKAKYKFRVGAHPAMNFQVRELNENGRIERISQMRRFFAWELANNYAINKHLQIGLYYLQGNGLQKNGPRTTHFVSFNFAVTQIPVSSQLEMSISPSLYYLYLDGQEGNYISGVINLSHKKSPLSLHYAFNKTFTSNLVGNKDYMWNFTLNYTIHKKFSASQ